MDKTTDANDKASSSCASSWVSSGYALGLMLERYVTGSVQVIGPLTSLALSDSLPGSELDVETLLFFEVLLLQHMNNPVL